MVVAENLLNYVLTYKTLDDPASGEVEEVLGTLKSVNPRVILPGTIMVTCSPEEFKSLAKPLVNWRAAREQRFSLDIPKT